MTIVVFADIHANLSALAACYAHFQSIGLADARIAILGDYIDYGPRPAETIQFIRTMNPHYVLRGNHENAIVNDETGRFASDRGRRSVEFTRSLLDRPSMDFLHAHPLAKLSFSDERGRKILLVHGDWSDDLWGSMADDEMQRKEFMEFDLVISGHTHVPHFREVFYSCERPDMRNTKKTVFVNPGSVGQPRNHCNKAQYLICDTATEAMQFVKVPYDIGAEQRCYGPGNDAFYRERLERGV